MSAAVPPAELPPAEPGWYYVNRGLLGWSLERSGADEAAAALARIAHRNAFRQREAADSQAREHDATVAQSASSALRSMPDDKELACDTANLSPARAALLRTVAWLSLAQRRLIEAQQKASKHTDLVARRDAAKGDLDELEWSVKEAFRIYNQYASVSDPPDSRDVDRQRLAGLLSSAEWECSLSEEAGNGLVTAIAEHVVRTLEGRLPDLRVAVLVESVQPTLDHAREVVGQLRELLLPLCSLAEVTGSARATVVNKIVMPVGPAVELELYGREDHVEHWRGLLAALASDPLASLGDRPKPPGPKRGGGWLGGRK